MCDWVDATGGRRSVTGGMAYTAFRNIVELTLYCSFIHLLFPRISQTANTPLAATLATTAPNSLPPKVLIPMIAYVLSNALPDIVRQTAKMQVRAEGVTDEWWYDRQVVSRKACE